MTDNQHAAQAYAALVCIETGQWDAYLLRLLHVLRVRLQAPEVQQRWESGALLQEIPE